MRIASLCLCLCLTLAACQPLTPPKCSEAALIDLEAAYIAEVVTVCEGQDYDTCDAREAIDVKYDRLRTEWVYCQ